MAHISIDNLTVEFAIFGANSRSLKNQILSQATGGRVMSGIRDVVTVRAIDSLNLEINDGDRVGLIGHNGSGKTTLLRVIAGIYKPSGGALTIEGRVGALLDPTAGMDAESTGIENIYLRGYMLGMSRREIASKLDEIADFAELAAQTLDPRLEALCQAQKPPLLPFLAGHPVLPALDGDVDMAHQASPASSTARMVPIAASSRSAISRLVRSSLRDFIREPSSSSASRDRSAPSA